MMLYAPANSGVARRRVIEISPRGAAERGSAASVGATSAANTRIPFAKKVLWAPSSFFKCGSPAASCDDQKCRIAGLPRSESSVWDFPAVSVNANSGSGSGSINQVATRSEEKPEFGGGFSAVACFLANGSTPKAESPSVKVIRRFRGTEGKDCDAPLGQRIAMEIGEGSLPIPKKK